MTTNERTAFPTTTGTSPLSCDRIFTCGEAQIATSPFVYRGVGIFMPEKVGNLQAKSSMSNTFMRESSMSNIGSKSLTTSTKSPLAGGIQHIDAFRINIPC